MTLSVKQRVVQSRLYALTREIKWRLENYVSKSERQRFRVVSLVPERPVKGSVLLSRINRAFLLKPGEALPATHKNLWEAYQMALAFLELGFAVDVIDYTNNSFLPHKDYAIFVDAKWNMERIAPVLNKDCIKVLHPLSAHPLFHNAAELRRLLELRERRGVMLRPRRQDPLNWGIEHADCATVIGNEFTLSTYRYAKKPLYRLPSSWPTTYPWQETKDFEACRNRFFWFGGGGMVHKGLDLVLEVFASLPDCHLTICGPVEEEQDFVEAYHRELYETNNIDLVGWVDVSSPKFLQIARECVALIRPSCSEGGGAAVVGGMHAGLIPIVSYESSVDVSSDCGIVLKKSSIEEIRDSVRSVVSLPANRLREMARNTWERARTEHSPERFVEEYKKVISRLMAGERGLLEDSAHGGAYDSRPHVQSSENAGELRESLP